MQHLITTFALLLLVTISLAGQEIPYTIDVIDCDTTPVNNYRFEDVLHSPQGVYFRHSRFPDSEIITLFNGETYTEVYRGQEPMSLVGATAEGVYLLEDVPDVVFAKNLLFVTREGLVDTLNDNELSNPDTYQWGDDLYTFSFTSGVRSFTPAGTETVLATEFRDCICFDEFLEYDGRLIYRTSGAINITDGTSAGTRELFDFESDFFIYEDRLIIYDAFNGLFAYDPQTDQANDLFAGQPNTILDFFDPEGFTVTEHGVVFIATTQEAGRELYITDGTVGSIRLLTEVNPGPEDGISWQGVPVPLSVGNYLIFRRGPDEESREVWMTDGSVDGTQRLFEINDDLILSSGEFTGTLFNDGKLLLTAEPNFASDFPTYVYSVDPSLADFVVTSLDTISATLRGQTRYPVGDRVVVRAPVLQSGSREFLSFGATAGSTETLGELPDFGDVVYATSDLILLLSSASSGEENTLFLSRGRENDFSSVLTFSENSSTPLNVIEVNDDRFIYCNTDIYGETIFSFDAATPSTNFVADLYPDNASSDELNFQPVGSQLFLSDRFGDVSVPNLLLSTNPFEKQPVTTEQGAVLPTADNYIGNIESRHYFYANSSFSDALSEVDVNAGTLRNLDQLLPDAGAVIKGTPILTEDKMYRQAVYSFNNPRRVVYSLVEVDLLTSEQVVIVSDTAVENNNRLNTSIATDGRFVFFPALRGEGVGPAAYDTQTGTIVNIGPSSSTGALFFRRLGDQVYVDVEPEPGPVVSYPISPAGLGNALPVSIASADELAVLEQDIVFTRFGNLLGINLEAADSTLLLAAGSSFSIRLLQKISNREVIFFLQNQDTEVWELWRTDGSQPGTTKMLDLPEGSDFPSTMISFGSYFGLITDSDEKLFLIDPASDHIQEVEIKLTSFSERLASITNQLFVFADDPVLGQELHRIRIGGEELLRGAVFFDENSNGIQDEQEPGIPNASVSVSGGSVRTVYTIADGSFALPVREGETYDLSIRTPECYEVLTTPDAYQVTYSPDSTYSLPFGFGIQGGALSLRTLLNSSTIRCGFEHDFWLTVINDGCQPLAGEGRVTFPEEMVYLESDEVPLSSEDNTLVFAFDTLLPNASRRFRIRFRMPDENFAGLPIDLGAAAGAVDGQGAMIVSDTFAYSEILRCAIDPNDKQVSPSRPEPSGSNYTQLDETLRYTIRFQNTGNDTAFTVRIQDRISESLDLETFRPLAASHPYSVSLREDRTVVFLFENILLPDSTTNLPGSQGFVTFEINAHPDLDDFSTIDNTAGIYFDFNQPVITNTVTSTLVEFLDEDQDGFLFYEECDDKDFAINPSAAEIPNNGIDENCDDLDDFPVAITEQLPGTLRYFPNPATNQLNLSYSENLPLHGELYSADGQRIKSFSFQNAHSLGLKNLPAGLYLVRLYSREGRGVTLRVVHK